MDELESMQKEIELLKKEKASLQEEKRAFIEALSGVMKEESRKARNSQNADSVKQLLSKMSELDNAVLDEVTTRIIEDYAYFSSKRTEEVLKDMSLMNYLYVRDQALFELATIYDVEKFHQYQSVYRGKTETKSTVKPSFRDQMKPLKPIQ